MLGGAQHQPDDIGVAVLIAQHLVHHKTAGGKVAVDHQLRRLAQHDLGHFAVDPTAKVAPARLAFAVITGVDDVVARVNSFQQLAHLVGRGLAVVVQADDDITAALVETRHQRGMLAEVFRQIHAQHMGVRRHQAADGANGIIRRAVIDEDDLVVILGHRLHCGGNFRHHAAHRMLGAVAGNHIRNFLHSCVHPLNCAYKRPDPRWRQAPASFRPSGVPPRGCRGRT